MFSELFNGITRNMFKLDAELGLVSLHRVENSFKQSVERDFSIPQVLSKDAHYEDSLTLIFSLKRFFVEKLPIKDRLNNIDRRY